MKIAKIYWYWAKKYTFEAKIILLQQYTFIWKFCRNTPEHGTLVLCREAGAGHKECGVCIQRNILKAFIQVGQSDRDWLHLYSKALQDLPG